MSRPARMVKLLELLASSRGLEGEALAQACGASARTLRRDLAALRAAGFPVFYHRGYRLAFPVLLPPITFAANEALALRLAALSRTPKAEPAAVEALQRATDKLQQALAAVPPTEPRERQLSLALPLEDPRTESLAAALAEAIRERRTVKLTAATGGAPQRVDPYQLLSGAGAPALLAYSHARRRLLRFPLSRVGVVTATRRRYRPLPERVLQRQLRGGAEPHEFHEVQLLCRPPLALIMRKSPPAGALMWEEVVGDAIVVTLATLRPDDLLPWLLACSDAVEVLAPARLRQQLLRAARAIAERHAAEPKRPGARWGAEEPRPEGDDPLRLALF